MTSYEIADVIVSVLAFVISIIAIFIGISTKRKSNRQAMVATLNNIFVNIDVARARMEDHVSQMAPLAAKTNRTEADEDHLSILESVLDSKIEGLLTAYDDACQRLLARDVEESAFKSKYLHSIKELVEKYPEKFQDPVTRFRNLVAVYKRWYS